MYGLTYSCLKIFFKLLSASKALLELIQIIGGIGKVAKFS